MKRRAAIAVFEVLLDEEENVDCWDILMFARFLMINKLLKKSRIRATISPLVHVNQEYQYYTMRPSLHHDSKYIP